MQQSGVPAGLLFVRGGQLWSGKSYGAHRQPRTAQRIRTAHFALLIAILPGPAAGPRAFAETPPNGQAIFLQRCAKCHGDNGEGVSAIITIGGPSLKAEHDGGAVMTAMEVGPAHMPSFAWLLSVSEMHSVADYVTQHIAVMSLEGGDLAQGGKLFRHHCAPCHQAAGRGGALSFAGTNAPALTNFSPAIIAGAIRWGPGPMPAFPPSVLNDKQVASIVEYVKFVQHAPSVGGTPMRWYGPVAEGFVAWVGMFVLIAAVGWIEKGKRG